MAKLRDKIVPLDFWSTNCVPWIGEMPNLKAAAQKPHDLGFDVVAIPLHRNGGSLRRFIQEKELLWPRHFDGRGWQNRSAVRYGIFSIPTVWLVTTRESAGR